MGSRHILRRTQQHAFALPEEVLHRIGFRGVLCSRHASLRGKKLCPTLQGECGVVCCRQPSIYLVGRLEFNFYDAFQIACMKVLLGRFRAEHLANAQACPLRCRPDASVAPTVEDSLLLYAAGGGDHQVANKKHADIPSCHMRTSSGRYRGRKREMEEALLRDQRVHRGTINTYICGAAVSENIHALLSLDSPW